MSTIRKFALNETATGQVQQFADKLGISADRLTRLIILWALPLITSQDLRRTQLEDKTLRSHTGRPKLTPEQKKLKAVRDVYRALGVREDMLPDHVRESTTLDQYMRELEGNDAG